MIKWSVHEQCLGWSSATHLLGLWIVPAQELQGAVCFKEAVHVMEDSVDLSTIERHIRFAQSTHLADDDGMVTTRVGLLCNRLRSSAPGLSLDFLDAVVSSGEIMLTLCMQHQQSNDEGE